MRGDDSGALRQWSRSAVDRRNSGVRKESRNASRQQGCARHRRGIGLRQGHCRDLRARGRARCRHRYRWGGRARGCDVSQRADVNAAVKATVDAFGGIDILVNNAGMSHVRRPMLEVEEAEFDRLMAVNVKSIFLFAHAVVPRMRKQKSGVIINIGSTAGIRPRPGLTWYNASKGAVNLVSKSMAAELAPDGIRVCAIAPVMAETPLLPTFMGGDSPELRAQFKATVPLGRFATIDDVANAALFLASDEASFLTGNVLEVDGGRCV